MTRWQRLSEIALAVVTGPFVFLWIVWLVLFTDDDLV